MDISQGCETYCRHDQDEQSIHGVTHLRYVEDSLEVDVKDPRRKGQSLLFQQNSQQYTVNYIIIMRTSRLLQRFYPKREIGVNGKSIIGMSPFQYLVVSPGNASWVF